MAQTINQRPRQTTGVFASERDNMSIVKSIKCDRAACENTSTGRQLDGWFSIYILDTSKSDSQISIYAGASLEALPTIVHVCSFECLTQWQKKFFTTKPTEEFTK